MYTTVVSPFLQMNLEVGWRRVGVGWGWGEIIDTQKTVQVDKLSKKTEMLSFFHCIFLANLAYVYVCI